MTTETRKYSLPEGWLNSKAVRKLIDMILSSTPITYSPTRDHRVFAGRALVQVPLTEIIYSTNQELIDKYKLKEEWIPALNLVLIALIETLIETSVVSPQHNGHKSSKINEKNSPNPSS